MTIMLPRSSQTKEVTALNSDPLRSSSSGMSEASESLTTYTQFRPESTMKSFPCFLVMNLQSVLGRAEAPRASTSQTEVARKVKLFRLILTLSSLEEQKRGESRAKVSPADWFKVMMRESSPSAMLVMKEDWAMCMKWTYSRVLSNTWRPPTSPSETTNPPALRARIA